MELKTYFAQDAAGNIISSAIVNVFLQGTTTLATGLTRADGTPLENPFAADGAGRIQFRAPDGYYDVQVSAGPGIIQTLTIQCVDYSEAKSAAEQAQDALNSIAGINTNFEQNSREQWRRSLAEAGLTLVSGSFEEGATANSSTDAVWHIAVGQCYTWNGAFPKTVPADSTTISTGGVGPGAWVSVGSTALRQELAQPDGADKIGSPYGGTISSDMMPSVIKKIGTFQSGALITDGLQALYDTSSGDWYTYIGAIPGGGLTVPAGSSPNSSWVSVGLLNGSPINSIKNWVLDASLANASATTSRINLMLSSLVKLNIFSCRLNDFSETHINGTLNLSAGMRVIGNGMFNNPLVYHGTGDAIVYNSQIYFENFNLKQGDTAWTGRAIVCPGQQAYCSFHNVNVEGFRYGHVARYSIWIKYSNVRMKNVACAFRFLRNSTATDKNDPIASGGWNLNGGWFHNVMDMSLVTIDGCEVGIWGSPMCAVINAPTVQNVAARGAGTNLVLPDGIDPCAMYLQGGTTTTATDGAVNWNLQINQLYIEWAKAGVLIEGYRLCKISLFVQGGPSAERMKFAVKATSGSNVIVTDIVGQDHFESLFVADSKSTIEVQRRVGPMVGPMSLGDSTGLITYKEQDKIFNLNAAAGVSGRKYLIAPVATGSYELEVQGVVDGISIAGGIFDISIRTGTLWASAYTSLQTLSLNAATPIYPDGKTSTPISIDVSGGNLYLIVGTGLSYSARIILRNKVRWNYSSPIEIPDSPI